MSTLATHCYTGRKKCGCMVTVVSDLGDEYTAAHVADFIRCGYTVERMTIEDFRKSDFCECKCGKQDELFKGGQS